MGDRIYPNRRVRRERISRLSRNSQSALRGQSRAPGNFRSFKDLGLDVRNCREAQKGLALGRRWDAGASRCCVRPLPSGSRKR